MRGVGRGLRQQNQIHEETGTLGGFADAGSQLEIAGTSFPVAEIDQNIHPHCFAGLETERTHALAGEGKLIDRAVRITADRALYFADYADLFAETVISCGGCRAA